MLSQGVGVGNSSVSSVSSVSVSGAAIPVAPALGIGQGSGSGQGLQPPSQVRKKEKRKIFGPKIFCLVDFWNINQIIWTKKGEKKE